jgi:hypothetical protein
MVEMVNPKERRMKAIWMTAAVALTGAAMAGGSFGADVPRVYVPGPGDQNAYQPQVQPKPLPPPDYVPGQPYQPGQPGQPGMMPGQPMGQPGVLNRSIPNEQLFVQAYAAHRNPRIMVFVNRTITGEALPKDGLEELMRVEEKQRATGALSVQTNNTSNSNSQNTSTGYGGANASNSNSNTVNSGSFSSNGPAEYSKITSTKKQADKYDQIGASADDYQLIEASIVKYFDNSGKVTIQDAEAARGKLDREMVLRIENGDPAAQRLLSTELQQDILIRVTAVPTSHASVGPAVRLMAKAVSTTDARSLGTAFVDMPLPMTKTNINIYTGYLSSELMGEIAKKWTNATDTVEVRIYKAASVDDSLKVRSWLQKTRGVSSVTSRGATGGATTSYSAFAVNYSGAPEDLYADLKDAIGASQGLKAVDLQNNTISLEVTGTLNLVTTTRKTETMTTTTTTEERRVEPINPAPADQGAAMPPVPTPVAPVQ